MCYYKVNNKNNNEKRVYMFNVKLFSERLTYWKRLCCPRSVISS